MGKYWGTCAEQPFADGRHRDGRRPSRLANPIKYPVPILLVGAGLALSKSGLELRSDSGGGGVKAAFGPAAGGLTEATQSVRDGLHDAVSGAQETARQT